MATERQAAQKRQADEKKDERSEANKRQEAVAQQQERDAKSSASKAKAIDTGKFTVVLRDDADSTVDSVTKLLGAQGAQVKSSSGNKLTVELPGESERNTGAYRQRIVEHVLGDPLVEDIE